MLMPATNIKPLSKQLQTFHDIHRNDKKKNHILVQKTPLALEVANYNRTI